jgi:hypothetical protein
MELGWSGLLEPYAVLVLRPRVGSGEVGADLRVERPTEDGVRGASSAETPTEEGARLLAALLAARVVRRVDMMGGVGWKMVCDDLSQRHGHRKAQETANG